jgi:hypothetical protein
MYISENFVINFSDTTTSSLMNLWAMDGLLV